MNEVNDVRSPNKESEELESHKLIYCKLMLNEDKPKINGIVSRQFTPWSGKTQWWCHSHCRWLTTSSQNSGAIHSRLSHRRHLHQCQVCCSQFSHTQRVTECTFPFHDQSISPSTCLTAGLGRSYIAASLHNQISNISPEVEVELAVHLSLTLQTHFVWI